jgi:hypothetical protein
MKTETILNQIGVVVNKFNKEQIKNLIEIFKMLSMFAANEIISVQTEKVNFELGQKFEYNRWGKNTISKGDKVESEVFEICTKNGRYKQIIPVNNDLHRAFCLKFKNELPGIESLPPLAAFTVSKQMALTLSKIAETAKKPKVFGNENLEFVRFELLENAIKVIASDGYNLVNVELKTSVSGGGVWYIKPENLKGLKAGEIEFYQDKIIVNKVAISQSQELPTNYPNYMNVWPIGYNKAVTVFKNDLVTAIKQAKTTANKVTKCIDLHVNGSINVTGKDLDFAHETSLSINYLDKNYIEGFDISFNADNLLKSLAVITSDTVTINHGAPSKAIILNNEVLVMPLYKAN